jgi:general secretion pathway protein G
MLLNQPVARNQGFTLIELMVVLVIIAVITGLVAQNFIGRDQAAMRQVAIADISTIDNALQLYRLDNGVFPSTQQGLSALLTPPTGQPQARNWRGPYLRNQPIDPWGNPYQYVNHDGQTVEIISLGADGQPGGTGDAADISSRHSGR